MALNLTDLIAAADKELADVESAKTNLSDAQINLVAAQEAVADAQEESSQAETALTTQRAEALAALQAIVNAVNAEIENVGN